MSVGSKRSVVLNMAVDEAVKLVCPCFNYAYMHASVTMYSYHCMCVCSYATCRASQWSLQLGTMEKVLAPSLQHQQKRGVLCCIS